jgi:hypothetical protein
MHLSCAGRADRSGFTMVASQIDLESLRLRREQPVAKFDPIRDPISEYETSDSVDNLRDLISAPLARLVHAPYLRLGAPSSSNLFARPTLSVDVFLPGGGHDASRSKGEAKASSAALGELAGKVSIKSAFQEDEARCDEISAWSQLASSEAGPGTDTGDPGDELELVPKATANGSTRTLVYELRGKRAGLYLLTARMEAPHGAAPTSIRAQKCIRLEGGSAQLGAWFVWLPMRLDQRNAAPTSMNNHFAVVATLSSGRDTTWGPLSLTPGLLAGYSAHYRAVRSPPSWGDVATGRVGTSGETDLNWMRRALLLGTFLDFDLPLGGGPVSRRWGLLSRIYLNLDIGWIDPSDIPSSMTTYLSGRTSEGSIFDVDISGGLALGARHHFSSRWELSLLGQIAWLGADDLVGGWLVSSRLRRIEYDSVVAWGFSLALAREVF